MNNNPNENDIQQGVSPVASENMVNSAIPSVVSTPVPTQPSFVQNSTTILQQQPVPVVENVLPTATVVQSTSSPVVTQTPQTAEAIVAQVEQQAAEALAEVKDAPIPPQQNRIQLVDDKPKLNAVILNNGTAVSTNSVESEVSENTEILDVVEEPSVVSEAASNNDKKEKSHAFGLIVLFGGLFLLVIFLPDISNYVKKQKYLRDNPVEEKITTGKLVCNTKDSDDKFDFFYEYSIDFSDEKITKIMVTDETKGDSVLDEKKFDELLDECKNLKGIAEEMSGIRVSCSLDGGIFTRNQVFELSSIVDDSYITAYVEAGGTYVNYKYNSELEMVESELLSSNFDCKRKK